MILETPDDTSKLDSTRNTNQYQDHRNHKKCIKYREIPETTQIYHKVQGIIGNTRKYYISLYQ